MPAPSSRTASVELASPDVASADEEQRTRLTWLALFRVVATVVLLLIVGIRYLLVPSGELSFSELLPFAVIIVVLGASIVFGVALRFGKAGTGAAYAQIIGDVLVATCIVYVTGASESPFAFTYSVAIIAGAILQFQRGAYLAATAASAAFIALVVAVQRGFTLDAGLATRVSPKRFVFVIVSQVAAQFLIASLAGYLARQLATTGGRLQAREERIAQLLGLQDQIVNAMPSGLLTCDGSGHITFVNPAAAAILGASRSPVGEAMQRLMPGIEHVRPGTRRAELEVSTPSGPRTLGVAVTPLSGIGDGASLVVFQDLTDLRRTEEKLKTADHLASLGKFSAQLAHEIRNPLASMRGAAQLLGGEAGTDGVSGRLAGIVIREADRLSRLVEDFLKFARPPPPKLSPVSLRQLVDDTAEMLKTDPLARGVRLEVRGAEVYAMCDAGQIRQVLLNLGRNALSATGAGGSVRLECFSEEAHVGFRVWDSAGKIPAQDLPRLFEPFYTTRQEGTGLGLSTVHSIVTAHGGDVTVTSSPDRGTEFVVTLTGVEA